MSYSYPARGYHHITACAGRAQEDVDFFTGIVGQRLAKQTVLMDGKFPHYHLYYSNANIEPGSIMTTFPYSRIMGRRGSGQVQSITYTVAPGTLPFWQDHFKRHKVEQGPIEELRSALHRLPSSRRHGVRAHRRPSGQKRGLEHS